MKIAWVCDECNWLQVSDSKEHHQMDKCKCSKCGVDLEEYGCRVSGLPRIIAKTDDNGIWRIEKPKNYKYRCKNCKDRELSGTIFCPYCGNNKPKDYRKEKLKPSPFRESNITIKDKKRNIK